MDLEPSNSAIVTVDVPGAAEKLARARIEAAVRDDRLRVSFHLYNTAADVDAALDALRS
jgi:selenocysteine lyase/cysteine desulfurase